jgi:hypothetical protein
MKISIPSFITEGWQILKVSKNKKNNSWNYQEYEEDKVCYPYHIYWMKNGVEKITEISCYSSRRFGGTCECINHAPYYTYTKGNIEDSVFNEMLSRVEWE